jgi:signal peptidase II
MTPAARRLRGSLVVAAVVVAVDQLTKWWAVAALGDGPMSLFWTLRFNLVYNFGMAFGQGRGLGPLISVIGLVIVAVLLISVGRGSRELNWFGVGLVVGGAIGNIADRLLRDPYWLRGGVVDFIDLQWFPVFNVADIAINVGAAILIISALLEGRRELRP